MVGHRQSSMEAQYVHRHQSKDRDDDGDARPGLVGGRRRMGIEDEAVVTRIAEKKSAQRRSSSGAKPHASPFAIPSSRSKSAQGATQRSSSPPKPGTVPENAFYDLKNKDLRRATTTTRTPGTSRGITRKKTDTVVPVDSTDEDDGSRLDDVFSNSHALQASDRTSRSRGDTVRHERGMDAHHLRSSSPNYPSSSNALDALMNDPGSSRPARGRKSMPNNLPSYGDGTPPVHDLADHSDSNDDRRGPRTVTSTPNMLRGQAERRNRRTTMPNTPNVSSIPAQNEPSARGPRPTRSAAQRPRDNEAPFKRTFIPQPLPKNSDSDEDPIESFEDSLELPKGKGKGKERGQTKGKPKAPLVAATAQAMAAGTLSPVAPRGLKRRPPMQKKDGTLPEKVSPPSRQPKASSSIIPSSGLTHTATIEDCVIETEDGRMCKVDATELHFQPSTKPLSIEFRKPARGRDTKPAKLVLDKPLTKVEIGKNVPFMRFFKTLNTEERIDLKGLCRPGSGHTKPALLGEVALAVFFHVTDDEKNQKFLEQVDIRIRKIPTTYLGDDDVEMLHVLYTAEANFEPKRPQRSSASQAAAQAAMSRHGDKTQKVRHTDRGDKGKGKATPEDPAQTRLSFDGHVARRSSRLSGYDSDVVEQSHDVVLSRRQALDNTVLFHYPTKGDSLVEISVADKWRVEHHEFLNDTVLEFGLRYTLLDLMKEDVRERVYMFNSFFYERLAKKDKKHKATDDEWPAYDSVKKWTKRVDIFDKELIIVPINEQLHWYLAVIYNPKGILEPTGGSPERHVSPNDGSNGPLSRTRNNGIASGSRSRVVSGDESGADLSHDPLDVMSDVEDGDRAPEYLSGGDHTSENNAQSPQPIQSQTYEEFSRQGLPLRDQPPPPEPEPEPEPKKAGNAQGKTTREDHDILGSNKTYIVTLDSLGGAHRAVGNTLNRWLEFEAREKRGVKHELSKATYIEAKVPQQPNFSDCGLFLIHYVNCLLGDLRDRKRVLKFIGKAPPPLRSDEREAFNDEMKDVWQASKTGNLRQDWVQRMDDLTGEWRSLHDQPLVSSPRKSEVAKVKSAGDATQADVQATQGSVIALSQPPLVPIEHPLSPVGETVTEPMDVDEPAGGVGAADQVWEPMDVDEPFDASTTVADDTATASIYATPMGSEQVGRLAILSPDPSTSTSRRSTPQRDESHSPLQHGSMLGSPAFDDAAHELGYDQTPTRHTRRAHTPDPPAVRSGTSSPAGGQSPAVPLDPYANVDLESRIAREREATKPLSRETTRSPRRVTTTSPSIHLSHATPPNSRPGRQSQAKSTPERVRTPARPWSPKPNSSPAPSAAPKAVHKTFRIAGNPATPAANGTSNKAWFARTAASVTGKHDEHMASTTITSETHVARSSAQSPSRPELVPDSDEEPPASAERVTHRQGKHAVTDEMDEPESDHRRAARGKGDAHGKEEEEEDDDDDDDDDEGIEWGDEPHPSAKTPPPADERHSKRKGKERTHEVSDHRDRDGGPNDRSPRDKRKARTRNDIPSKPAVADADAIEVVDDSLSQDMPDSRHYAYPESSNSRDTGIAAATPRGAAPSRSSATSVRGRIVSPPSSPAEEPSPSRQPRTRQKRSLLNPNVSDAPAKKLRSSDGANADGWRVVDDFSDSTKATKAEATKAAKTTTRTGSRSTAKGKGKGRETGRAGVNNTMETAYVVSD